MWNPFRKKKPVDPLKASLERGECPDCQSQDFTPGPAGGMSLNMECCGCGSCFNIAPADDLGESIEIQIPLFMAHRIGWNNSGHWIEPGKRKPEYETTKA